MLQTQDAVCHWCIHIGVTAAFDAPVAGALFAIEFVLKGSRLGLDRLSTSTVFVAVAVAAGVEAVLRTQVRRLCDALCYMLLPVYGVMYACALCTVVCRSTLTVVVAVAEAVGLVHIL